MALDLATTQTPKLMVAFWKKFLSVPRFCYQQNRIKNIHSNTLKQCDKECDNIGKAPGTLYCLIKITFPSLASPKGFNTFLEHTQDPSE